MIIHGALVLLGAADDHIVNVIELADLADDQAGRGKGVALGLEHILDGTGHIGKI